MNEALYSVLWFVPELTGDVLSSVKRYILTGKKVFLLSFDDPAEIVKDDYLHKAAKKNMLSTFLIRYTDTYNEELIIYDGKEVDNEFLAYFDEVSSFNLPQYILEHKETKSNSLVKAGAGTGKTTTMINRIAYLKHRFQSAVNLQGFVLITFTNEASIHMRAKLMQKFKDYYDITGNAKYLEWLEEMSSMFIGTIHAFASYFLSHEGKSLGFPHLIEIRSYRHEQRKQIEKAIDKFASEYEDIYQAFKRVPHYQMVRLFSQMIEQIHNKAISQKDILKINYGLDEKQFHFYAQYIIRYVTSSLLNLKQQEGTMEVHDLISRLDEVRFLRDNDLSLPLKYVFVDEFQDTDESQVRYVSWLASKYKAELFAVGDVKQSIYRFRGADYTAFNQLIYQLDINQDPFQEYSLQKNYRSTTLLLSQFNKLFTKWDDRVKRFTYNQSDVLKPVIEAEESEGLTTIRLDDTMLKHLLKHLYGKEVAFLVRSNRQASETVKRIEKAGYFCDAELSGSFFRSIPVREFYLLVRRLTHHKVPKDRFAFHQSSYGKNNLHLMEVIQQLDYEKNTTVETLDRLEEQPEIMSSENALHFLEKIIQDTNPADIYRKRFYQEKRADFPDQDISIIKDEAILRFEEYKANLEHLLFILKKEFSHITASIYDIEKFLSIKIATDTSENEWKQRDEKLHRFKVMTVHKAKGLEFDHVILPSTEMTFLQDYFTNHLLVHEQGNWNYGYDVKWYGMNFQNNLFKMNISDENAETIGEETRLLYVALTRAKNSVIVHGSDRMNASKIECWNDLVESGEKVDVQGTLL
jgi:DNA helicase II / ATP-dependent DNA helicase PcrA